MPPQLLLAAAEADAEARLRIGEAKPKAEEKYIALSESGSSVGFRRDLKINFA